jgi:nitroreductase
MPQIPEALGLTTGQVAALLEAAGRAPSLHNSQPWLFRVTPAVIELHADPDRRLPAADPQGRELRLACGAALFNLRIAMLGMDVRPTVTVLPDPATPGLIAAVRNGGTKRRTPAVQRLLQAIPCRHTTRRPFADVPVDPAARAALQRAASDEGAWLHLVEDRDQRAALRGLARRAHEVQMSDTAFRAELAAWTGRDGGHDEPPTAAGGPLPEPQDDRVLRDYTRGQGRARAYGTDFEPEPLVAVLTAHLSGPLAEVHAGEALQRVLLAAAAEGMAVSFLSHVTEVPDIREAVRRVIGGTRPPQAVLRIGQGLPVPATPRRPVADLLREQVPAERGGR